MISVIATSNIGCPNNTYIHIWDIIWCVWNMNIYKTMYRYILIRTSSCWSWHEFVIVAVYAGAAAGAHCHWSCNFEARPRWNSAELAAEETAVILLGWHTPRPPPSSCLRDYGAAWLARLRGARWEICYSYLILSYIKYIQSLYLWFKMYTLI